MTNHGTLRLDQRRENLPLMNGNLSIARVRWVSAVFAVLGMSCTGGTLNAGYNVADGSGAGLDSLPTDFCNPINWKATTDSTSSSSVPGQGVDGNLGSRWTSGRIQDGTDWYQVNFPGRIKLSEITLNNTGDNSSNDYPRGYAVYGSEDGVNFSSTPFATGMGTPGSTVIDFAEHTVMAIRINDTGSVNGALIWWSIGEFQTNCSV
jgi:hypothetical protein